jgi:hypothetical protein
MTKDELFQFVDRILRSLSISTNRDFFNANFKPSYNPNCVDSRYRGISWLREFECLGVGFELIDSSIIDDQRISTYRFFHGDVSILVDFKSEYMNTSIFSHASIKTTIQTKKVDTGYNEFIDLTDGDIIMLGDIIVTNGVEEVIDEKTFGIPVIGMKYNSALMKQIKRRNPRCLCGNDEIKKFLKHISDSIQVIQTLDAGTDKMRYLNALRSRIEIFLKDGVDKCS